MSVFIFPVAAFVMVVAIVAIVNVAKLRDEEAEVHRVLHAAQLEHKQTMMELQQELERVRQAG